MLTLYSVQCSLLSLLVKAEESDQWHETRKFSIDSVAHGVGAELLYLSNSVDFIRFLQYG